MRSHKSIAWPLGVAAAVRLLSAMVGFEHYGDAPVRIEIAERWAAQPHLWRGFTETYQYGPLHLTLIGALIRVFGDRVFAARLLSFACGLACVYFLYKIAQRERGEQAAFWSAMALAFSPLHIQASATGASEAVFLAMFLGTLWLVLEDRAVLAALLLGAAGLVRYDGWMYVPLFGALLWLRRRNLPRAAGFCAIAAVPAIFWMWVNLRATGDALAAIRHIDADHRALADMMLGWFGQWWRLYGLVYWPIAVLGVATPVFGALGMIGAFRALRRRGPGWEIAALAWLPALYFTFRTAILADFRPMARFAIVAGTLSLIFLPEVPRVWRRVALAAAVILPLFLFAASWRRDGTLAEWARPLSPVGSLPPGIADASRWIKANVQPSDAILLDGVWNYLDIPLAFAANLPERQWIRAAWVKEFEGRLQEATPTMAVLIYQGKLGDWTQDRYEFRGLQFCKVERFSLAAIYRRCDR